MDVFIGNGRQPGGTAVPKTPPHPLLAIYLVNENLPEFGCQVVLGPGLIGIGRYFLFRHAPSGLPIIGAFLLFLKP